MTQLSLEFRNDNLVRQGLQDLAAEVPQIGRLGIYRGMQSAVRRMKEYPPVPPMSQYIRTGTLGAGWFITPNSSGYTMSNNTPYTKHVVGNAYGLEQAWMHQQRWQLLRDVVEDEISKMPEEIINEISTVARRVGL